MVNFYINDELVESVRFPITEAGGESTVTMIVENPFRETVELMPYTNDVAVQVVDYPKKLGPMQTGKSTWVFKPESTRETSLKTEAGFKVIIG